MFILLPRSVLGLSVAAETASTLHRDTSQPLRDSDIDFERREGDTET